MKNKMEKFVSTYSLWIKEHTKLFALGLLIVTLFLGLQLTKLQVNPSLFLLDKQDTGRIHMAEARELFSSTGEQIFIGVLSQQESIFNQDSLATVAKLSQQFQYLSLVDESDTEKLNAMAIDEVSTNLVKTILLDKITFKDKRNLTKLVKHYQDQHSDKVIDIDYLNLLVVRSAPIVKIRSLSNVENIQLDDDSLDVSDLMATVPATKAGIKALEQQAYDNNLYLNSLISNDRKATTIQIELAIDEEDSYNLQKIYQNVLTILDTVETKDSFHIGGSASYLAAITEIVEKDNNKFFPFVIIVIAILLYASFRRWQGVWIPLTIAVITLIWTMGTVSMLGYKLNIITNMIPVFLISIAVADSIHFLSAYYKAAEKNNKSTAVTKSLDHLMTPMLLTTITTFCGFMALAVSNLSFIREFGLFVAIGVVFAFILTVSMLPLIMPLLKLEKASIEKSNHNILLRLIDSTSLRINKLSISRPVLVLLCFFVVLGGAGWLGSQISVDNENLASFSSTTRVYQDNQKLNKHLGGTIPVSIWFEADNDDAMKSPEMMKAVRQIQTHLNNNSNIGYTLSYVDYLDRIHEVMANDGLSQLPVNASRELISQYFLLYEFSQGNDIQDVVDFHYKNSRIIALSYTDKGSVWQNIIKDVKAYAGTVLPDGVNLKIAGMGELQASNIPEIVNSQINSFIISVVLISLVMIVLFRSLVLGLIGVIPLVTTIVFLGGVMFLLDIPLDIGTSMVCGICFGIGIDYTIHFISVFKRKFIELSGNWDETLKETTLSVCRPIIVNSITLSLGFSMLTFSDYAAIRNLGLLIGCSMVICAIFTLFLLPAIIRLIKPEVLVKRLNEVNDAVPA